MPKHQVVIIGAGLSGLSAAIQLQNEGIDLKILESSDSPGGRLRTDRIDGFLLDRGFQVLPTAYPELRQPPVDLNALQLHHFSPGACIYSDQQLHRLADPFRQPLQAFSALFSPLTTWNDKIKVIALRNRLRRLSIAQIFEQPEVSTAQLLRDWNFSPRFIQTFLRPLLTGMLLDPHLQTSSRMAEFILKMFAEGSMALPHNGIEALPRQLAAQLQPHTLLLQQAAVKIENNKVKTATGDTYEAEIIIVATDADQARQLLGDSFVRVKSAYTAKCLYFSTDKAPIDDSVLLLNGNADGLVNHMCIPSLVNPNYAPVDRHLVSVSVVKDTGNMDDNTLQNVVKKELRAWFKKEVRYWEHLKTYHLASALPAMHQIRIPQKQHIQPVLPYIFMCGDHTHSPSINAALESGRYTAHAVSWHLALNRKK